MNKKQLHVLQQARVIYGFKTQIAVSAEECCELAKELLKYLRYETHDLAVKETKDSVVSEVADVTIILDHIMNVFEISEDELNQAIEQKIQRLSRWLNTNESIEYTTKDRELSTQELQ